MGRPPRCRCPRTRLRDSRPVSSSRWRATRFATPPSRFAPPRSRVVEIGGLPPLRRYRALRHDHDRELRTLVVAPTDMPGDLLDVEGYLGDQDRLGGRGEASEESDPTRVAAHQLDNHDPLVRGRGRVQLVDGVGGGLHRGVEAEGDRCRLEVVVDRLRHSDHAETLRRKFAGDPERAVAPPQPRGNPPSSCASSRPLRRICRPRAPCRPDPLPGRKKGCCGWWCRASSRPDGRCRAPPRRRAAPRLRDGRARRIRDGSRPPPTPAARPRAPPPAPRRSGRERPLRRC